MAVHIGPDAADGRARQAAELDLRRTRWYDSRAIRVSAGAALMLALAAGVTAVSMNESSDRMSVEEILQALAHGDIAKGDKLPGGRLPKPWMAEAYPKGETVSAIYVIRDDQHTILLYHHNWGELFAACTVKAPPDGGEIWHFYDAALMAEHVQRTRGGR